MKGHSKPCSQRVSLSLGLSKIQELKEWRLGNDAKPKPESQGLSTLNII